VNPAVAADPARLALRVRLSGRVQGVGFRPFVHQLARRHGLTGRVCNAGARVEIEVCGPRAALDAFLRALLAQAPPLSRPRLDAVTPIEPLAAESFSIADSRPEDAGAPQADAHLPPDQSLCRDCARELADPGNRRHRHPFVNCTQCGPRYTVIRALPYDRAATSMAGFAMCPDCRREYRDPLDRRFHAEPIACPACGPRLRFDDGRREVVGDAAALVACLAALREGAIVAVKGIGGYHLLCDAHDGDAIDRLRARKARPHKPLAVMFPQRGARGLDALRRELDFDDVEAAALCDPARPIVLLRRGAGCRLPPSIAPGLDEVGAFLPYSPLHALLLDGVGGPLVATSGNLSGEPVLTDPDAAAQRLAGIADAFVHHDRPIERPADDAVVRVILDRARPIRHGRGTAPFEAALGQPLAAPVLAVGGQSKVTLTLAFRDRLVLSPHVGDLDSPRGRAVFATLAADLQRLYGVQAGALVADRHPGYASTRWAHAQGLPVHHVQHHRAHASALAWERADVRHWLVLAWDGVGLGDDDTLWGGEAFVGAPGAWQRRGSWRPFRPPGGDRAAREPWRSAAALHWEAGWRFDGVDGSTALAHAAWCKGLQSPPTSAVGRLFDAAACGLLGLQRCSYEAQGPMQLEALARTARGPARAVPLPMVDDLHGVLRIDWAPLLERLTDARVAPAARAADCHATLAEAAAAQASALRERQRFDAVGLTGGVFQNRLLVEQLAARLEARGLPWVLPQRVAVNDGGLSFGQAVEFAARGPERPVPGAGDD
jgi:hydrogenase maturation protein HypF